MTTPAVLYDHVPVAEKKSGDEKRDINDATPFSSSSFRSYFVSRMVHQVSAPPEHADETRHKQQQPPQEDPEDNTQQSSQEMKKEDDEDGSDSSVVPPMETIWEDSVCTEYVFVPYSTISEDNVMYDEHNGRMALHSSRMNKIHNVVHSLFSPRRSVAGTSPRPSPVQRSTIQSVLLEPLLLLSSYLSPYLPVPSPSKISPIFKSNDWVSETVIDNTGNRLILPGALVVMDASSQADLPALDNSPFQGPLVPPPLSNDFDNENAASSEGTLIVPPAPDAELTTTTTWSGLWPWRSTTVMVSAHDLLAIEREKKAQKGQRMTYTDPESVSATSASLWIVPEGEEDMDVARQLLAPRMMPGRQEVRLSNQETFNILQALWKLTKRRTRRWYRLSYYRVSMTAKQVGRALLSSSSMHLIDQVEEVPPSRSSDTPLARSVNVSHQRVEKGGGASGRDCGKELVQLGNIDMIEMTPVRRNSIQDGLITDF